MAPHPSDPFAFADIHLLLHTQETVKRPRSRHGSSALSNPSFSGGSLHGSKRHRKRKSNSNNKAGRSSVPLHYLKPGALAQLRDAQKVARVSYSAANFCAKKKRIDDHGDQNESLMGPHQTRADADMEPRAAAMDSLTPVPSSRLFGPLCPQRKKLLAPKLMLPFYPATTSASSPVTPPVVSSPLPESLLESLPLELLVRIVCNLRHDHLKSAFHISKRLRQAVLIARQCHFDYTTPDRERQDIINTSVKRMFSRVNNNAVQRLPTPRAPRQAQRPTQARIPLAELQQLAVPLFRNGHHHMNGHNHNHHNHHPRMAAPPPPCPPGRAVASHRVLFYEDELCQAVAQNTL